MCSLFVILTSLFLLGLKIRPVLDYCRAIWFAGCRQLVKFFRPFLITQAAVADTQLDTGQIAITIRRNKAASAVVPGTSQSKSIPICSLTVSFLLEKPASYLTADLRPGPIISKSTEQRCQCRFRLAQLLPAIGAVAAGINVILHPAFPL